MPSIWSSGIVQRVNVNNKYGGAHPWGGPPERVSRVPIMSISNTSTLALMSEDELVDHDQSDREGRL
jgi:hypothetical protein